MSLQWEPRDGLRLGDSRLSVWTAVGIVLVSVGLWAVVWLAFCFGRGNH